MKQRPESVKTERTRLVRERARIAYAARSMRGFFTLNLPVSATVRHDFRLDLIGALLYGVFNGSAVGYIYVVARTIGVSQFGISLLVAMGAIGAMLCLPASLVVKPEGSRTFLFASMIIGRSAPLLILVLSGPVPYMIIISVFFITGGITAPFYAEVMQHIYPREFRGQLMSLVRIGSGTAMTISSLLTAWIFGSGYISYQVLFGLGGVLALASVLTFARITPVRPSPRPRHTVRDLLLILRRNRGFARYETWVSTMASGATMAGTLYPLVIVDKLHAGYGSFGVLTVIGSLGYLTSWFWWGRVIDHMGPVFTMLVVGLSALALPVSMLVAPGVYWLVLGVFVNGVSSAGFEVGPVAAVIHYARAMPHDVPQFMAVHSILIGLRGILFPFVATLILAGHHYMLSLSAALLLSVTGTFMLWRMHVKEPYLSSDALDE